MKKKILIAFIAVIVILCCVCGVICCRNRDKNWYPGMTILCCAKKYEQTANVGYLTITTTSGMTLVAEAADEKLQLSLLKANLDDVIGADITVIIPAGLIEEQHWGKFNFAVLDYALHDTRCRMVLRDVFYK